MKSSPTSVLTLTMLAFSSLILSRISNRRSCLSLAVILMAMSNTESLALSVRLVDAYTLALGYITDDLITIYRMAALCIVSRNIIKPVNDYRFGS